MFKKIMAALSAFILAGCLYAAAEDLVIDGLGKLSFGEDVQITDGGGSRAERLRKNRLGGSDVLPHHASGNGHVP